MIVCGQCHGKRRIGTTLCWVCKGRGFIGPIKVEPIKDQSKDEDKDKSSESSADS